MTSFKYDIAISLCKQDVEFARRFVSALNPNLKVFFYETRQEELINQMGPEVFARVFKEEARVVVILSRKEWGESFYTELERNAIVDRIVKGYGFLFVIPIVEKEIPAWYPETRIYANPRNNTVEQLAQFCEFKLAELGGVIKPLTYEEKVNHFHEKYEQRLSEIQTLISSESFDIVRLELDCFKETFNERLKLNANQSKSRIDGGFNPMQLDLLRAGVKCGGEITLDRYRFEVLVSDCYRSTGEVYRAGSQRIDLILSIIYFPQDGREGQTLRKELFRYNQSGEHYKGWSVVHRFHHGQLGNHRQLYFPEDLVNSYMLSDIIASDKLIDDWLGEIIDRIDQDIYKRPLGKAPPRNKYRSI